MSSIFSWFKSQLFKMSPYRESRAWSRVQWQKRLLYAAEWFVIVIVAYLYGSQNLLNFDVQQLQQTGEHNESATLPLLAEIGLQRYGEIPLWNPYMLTGFPHVGDFINHFWNPAATLPVLIWGGINGMKVSIYMSLVLAGLGQWFFAHVFGARSFFRLWTGLLYMLSGGLALLWRLGWYELLLGAAWFPWCFATLWWALHRKDRSSLVLTAVCITIVFTTGGGYYPLYLFVCMSLLFGIAVLWARQNMRLYQIYRAVAIAVLSVGLAAVVLLPWFDNYRYTSRDRLPDLEQSLSQPISYALMNYAISAPEWFGTDVLAKGSGWSWFYIGALPLIALLLIPLVYNEARWRRPALSALVVLTLVLLAWQANRYSLFKYIYDFIPFLYTFRFPNRLLIIATSPLIVLASLGLQHLLLVGRRWSRGWHLTIASHAEGAVGKGLPVKWVLYIDLFLIMAFSVRDVYSINKSFAFAQQFRGPEAFAALSWLKNYDPALYYTNLGGDIIYWHWVPAAYELEMPIINFRYNRRLLSMDSQNQPESPFAASPKYIFVLSTQNEPENGQLIKQFDEVGLWHLPDALPFAFTFPSTLLQSQSSPILTKEDVMPLTARYEGTNHVVVRGEANQAGEQLVVLVSDYPGWRLFIDGEPATLQAANGYLGANMRPGEHTYTFVFRPAKHYIGLAISSLTLLVMAIILLAESPFWRRRNAHSRAE